MSKRDTSAVPSALTVYVLIARTIWTTSPGPASSGVTPFFRQTSCSVRPKREATGGTVTPESDSVLSGRAGSSSLASTAA